MFTGPHIYRADKHLSIDFQACVVEILLYKPEKKVILMLNCWASNDKCYRAEYILKLMNC